jgi:hypothetical protein
MGYVGNQTTDSFSSIEKQSITGDGTPNYTLSHAVANSNEIEVFVNNVRQEPSVAYNASGTTLTMTGNVASTDSFYVVYQGKAVQVATHPADQALNCSDLNSTGTGATKLSTGTTAERPTGLAGQIRYNTTLSELEYHDGTSWGAVSSGVSPTVSSVTGDIYAGDGSDLVVAMINETDTVTIRFREGSTLLADVADQTVTNGSLTVAVPAAVYGQTAGDVIAVSVLNADGTESTNTINKTVQTPIPLPTGGTITTAGGYNYHTFTSSGSFVVATGDNRSVEALIIAGGGSSSNDGGGGGAGGLLSETKTLTPATYTVAIGGQNTNSSITSFTAAVRGGSGGGYQAGGGSGGSGGGGGVSSGGGGSGTSGQGNNGGSSGGNYASGGGGGKGSTGGSGSNPHGGAGGQGTNSFSAWASATSTGENGSYASGGGGGRNQGGSSTVYDGGGGVGATRISATGYTSNAPEDGQANTGGGAGGAGGHTGQQGGPGQGGSGLVIIRYAV